MVLMFGENKAQTLYKNLERMIALVLYDVERENRENEAKKQSGITIVDIIDQLKCRYSLNFSDAEVIRAINNKGQKRIICVETNINSAQKYYSITPAEYERIEQRESETKILTYINQFLEKHSDVRFTEDQMHELLNKHFYTVFNSNAAIILDLINRNYDYTDSLSTEQFIFTTEEKEAINQFLYWDDPGKNKCVYEMVSCCFDYCMMTTKQNSSTFKNIFNQKVFYLDANIIFRLMGLNHENRKRVIDTFIKKCEEQKIKVKITNHTRQEVIDTIEYHVKAISRLLGNKSPLEPRAVWSMSTWIVNQGFYEAYYNWCKDSLNSSGDFADFKRDLLKQANEILSQFEQKNYNSFAETEKNNFYVLVDSLSNYKRSHHRSTHDANIKTDVNNFMFVSACNSVGKGSDFFSIHNYLISADHTFGDWVKEIRPGSIPIVVLPSVWYSIMLQYSGRSDDDYASFTSFLNFSMSNNDAGGYSERKLEILKRVIALNERADIQSEIVYGIEERLRSGESEDIESEDIDNLITEVHQGIIDREVAAARDEERRIAGEKIEQYKAQTQNGFLKIATQTENELRLARDECTRLKDKAEEERKIAADNLQQGKEEAANKEYNRIVEIETNKRTKSTYKKYWIITICIALVSIIVVFGIAFWTSIQSTITETQKTALDWGWKGLGVIAFLGNKLVIDTKFKKLSYEKIEESIRKEVQKEYGKGK